MIADFDDFCTWMYVLISDLFTPIAPLVARPGPVPACTDAELITMAIVGECCGWDQETTLLSRWRAHRYLFPHQLERSRFNRRRRDLSHAINLVRQAVVHVLDLAQDTQCIIDSLPVPVVQFYYVPQASAESKVAWHDLWALLLQETSHLWLQTAFAFKAALPPKRESGY